MCNQNAYDRNRVRADSSEPMSAMQVVSDGNDSNYWPYINHLSYYSVPDSAHDMPDNISTTCVAPRRSIRQERAEKRIGEYG